MKRSEPENKFAKYKASENLKCYEKQRNFSCKLYKKEQNI